MDELVGTRTLGELCTLIEAGAELLFSPGEGTIIYRIMRQEEAEHPNFPYHIIISDDVPVEPVEIYHERYMALGNLAEYEPFDLSKFTIVRR